MKNEQIFIENALLPFYNKIKNNDFVIDKTGVKTVEVLGLKMSLDPTQKFLDLFGIRKSPVEYIQHEIEWYDSQDLSVKEIAKHAKLWLNVCSKDEQQVINSNYGYLVYSKENFNQYDSALAELSKNSFSRRSIIIYNRPSIQQEYNKNGMSDFICTLGQQFFIRHDKLISLVEMRSSDMMYGFFSDFPWFAIIQERMLHDLQIVYPSLDIGELIWISNSGHLYEKHFDLVQRIVDHFLSNTNLHV